MQKCVDYEVEGIRLEEEQKTLMEIVKRPSSAKGKQRGRYGLQHDMKEVNYMLNNSHKDTE